MLLSAVCSRYAWVGSVEYGFHGLGWGVSDGEKVGWDLDSRLLHSA